MGSTGLSGVVQACLLVVVTASAGCLAITIGSMTKQELDRTEVDVRVSSGQADLDGQLCYVDKKDRVVSRVSLSQKIRGLAVPFMVLEILVGGVMLVYELAVDDEAGQPAYHNGRPYGLIPLVDGLAAFTYFLVRDDSVSTSESWKRTSDTASCAR